MATPIDIRRGDVYRYHPVVGLPDYVRVRIMTEPYELGDGTLICKARRLGDEKLVYPAVRALSADKDA